MDGWMDGEIDRWIYVFIFYVIYCVFGVVLVVRGRIVNKIKFFFL